MFSGLLFLVLVLLIAALSPESPSVTFIDAPWTAFFLAMLSYAILLLIIYATSSYFQKWTKRHKSASIIIVNITLLLFLCFNSFVLSSQRVITFLPLLLTGAYTLSLYFGGLTAYHAGSYYQRFLYPESEITSRWQFAKLQLRMWIPFIIPFLFFSGITDFLTYLPRNSWTDSLLMPENDPISVLIFLSFTAVMIGLIMIFLPYIVQRLWLCEPIEDEDTHTRLNKLCRRANFRCAGMRLWTVMNHVHTAAIIGIIPRFRYIMFTKRLLDELSEKSIDAILIHEIGHSYRKHLLILPLIIFGMFISAGIFSLFFSEGIYQVIVIQNNIHPSKFWEVLVPLSILIPYALIMALYFRFIFGYFSRLFERQADLHGYEIGIPPQDMIDALDEIGKVTGGTHDHPSWHHFSIRERINFLKSTQLEPKNVARHHRKAKASVAIYLCLFVVITTILFSPLLNDVPLIGRIGTRVEAISNAITNQMTQYFNREK